MEGKSTYENFIDSGELPSLQEAVNAVNDDPSWIVRHGSKLKAVKAWREAHRRPDTKDLLIQRLAREHAEMRKLLERMLAAMEYHRDSRHDPEVAEARTLLEKIKKGA